MDASELTPEQESRQPLLKDFATILLSGTVDNDTYIELTWALRYGRVLHPDKPLILQINGMGGMITPAFGIVDLIRGDGNVWGVVYGRAASALATIWAACARRYIAPAAALAIHAAGMGTEGDFNAASLRDLADDLDFSDDLAVEIYTAASNKDIDYWRSLYFKSVDHVEVIPASVVIEYLEMAKPVSVLQSDWAATEPFSKTTINATSRKIEHWTDLPIGPAHPEWFERPSKSRPKRD